MTDHTQYILQALNSLRTGGWDVLVRYWENRLGVPHGTVASDNVSIKKSENNSLTLEEILDDVYYMTRHFSY